MKLYFLFILLLLVGCTAPTTTCPSVNCPSCNCAKYTTTTQPLDSLFNTHKLYVHYINVSQGLATLIKYNQTEILIDCGKNTEGLNVAKYLKDHNVNRLEYLIMTHPDSDHIGGCDDVLKLIPTSVVIYNGEKKDTTTFKEVMAQIDSEQLNIANSLMEIGIGPGKLSVIQTSSLYNDSNENSIVSRLDFEGASFLFTGDCDGACENRLFGKNINVDVLEVAHHGTKYATSTKMLAETSPKIAIISVGSNSYGHPAEETVDRILQNGIPLYRTDLDGNIIIESENGINTVYTRK